MTPHPIPRAATWLSFDVNVFAILEFVKPAFGADLKSSVFESKGRATTFHIDCKVAGAFILD